MKVFEDAVAPAADSNTTSTHEASMAQRPRSPIHWLTTLRAESDTHRIPEHVRVAIAQQQDHSEILIGWIQLAVTMTFAILYFVAPPPVNQVAFKPVPWFLASYFVFTLLRLYLARRISLPPWYLALSVVVDITLLIGLIWSFHIQYQQPASFVLKAPTLLYVFIFIALRALRFEACWVLLAGSVAAVEWLLLVVYVITIDPADAMITHDYVAYMTSNSVLLGAEFDKVVTILVVTAILALALTLARRLLVTAVRERSALQELSRFFSPDVAARITASGERNRAGHGEFRQAAVLYLDIRGFTALAQTTSTSNVMILLAEYQSRIGPIIRRHNGSIDKFLGDGILATFGAPVPNSHFLADALQAVDEIMEEVRLWNGERSAKGLAPLHVGAAVTADQILFGVVGDESRLEYTVIGDAVNLAAKLEKHNKLEKVSALTTLPAYEEACRQGYQRNTPPEVRPNRRIDESDRPLDLVVLWK